MGGTEETFEIQNGGVNEPDANHVGEASSDVDHDDDATSERTDSSDETPRYDWKLFAPSGVVDFFRWLALGFSPHAQLPPEQVQENFRNLARLLSLLREYESRFGMPEAGGQTEQMWVLKQLCKRLYASGTPIWVLNEALTKGAEGLTGVREIQFLLLPRSAFIHSPSTLSTVMFKTERGFHMRMLTIMERTLVRLASFSTNTKTSNSVQAEFPPPDKFRMPPRGDSVVFGRRLQKEKLAKEILNLAADGTGLFFFTHASEAATWHGGEQLNDFWKVESSIRELFTRLATIEAANAIDQCDDREEARKREYYSNRLLLFFRFLSSAGGTALWFSGSWEDVLVAGLLGVLVALVQGLSVWRHERVIFEVIVSFIVGLAAGLISISWPKRMCFGAIAVGSIIDILQGFRLVYSIMELMSKHTVTGGADFMEAFLFTGLIASFLKFGQFAAKSIRNVDDDDNDYTTCTNAINELYYIVICPIASVAWAVLFMPRVKDIPIMALHGILGFGTYYGVQRGSDQALVSTFVGALVVTFSAGIVSRFTGRQALGDTVTGLYVLVPGAYLAKGLFEAAESNTIGADLLYNIIVNSVVIGLGAWTGTLLCSPTILGTNSGLLGYGKSLRKKERDQKFKHGERINKNDGDTAAPILFF